jgi:hypothetical protein
MIFVQNREEPTPSIWPRIPSSYEMEDRNRKGMGSLPYLRLTLIFDVVDGPVTLTEPIISWTLGAKTRICHSPARIALYNILLKNSDFWECGGKKIFIIGMRSRLFQTSYPTKNCLP